MVPDEVGGVEYGNRKLRELSSDTGFERVRQNCVTPDEITAPSP